MKAFRADRVFDGRQMIGSATVVVDGGRITAIELGEVPDATDLGDVTLLPGLVDTHVHLAFDPLQKDDVVGSFAVDDATLLVRMHDHAAKQLGAGVTTVRDLGDRGFLATRLDTALTVLASGPPLTPVNGHCWFLGGEVEGVEAAMRAVEERAAQGCSVVKVMVSGGNITPGNSPFESQFRNPLLKQIVDEAHRLGMHTAGHVHAAGSVVDALDAGFDTLEHVTFMTPEGVGATPELLQRLVDSHVVVSVTAGALPGNTPPLAIRQRLEEVLDNMCWLAANGARIVVGSDAGVGPGKPHGVLPWAPDQLARGMDTLSSLRAMTSEAAKGIGLEGRKGVLAPGADADLLVVRGDPTVDRSALHDVVGVWAAGNPVGP
jgi:imidazolonepropionase-like amidohydrolase